MCDLTTNIGGLNMKNPVMTASGTFGFGLEFSDLVNIDRLGGIIVKGTTLEAREGNDYPRMAETPSGMLNAVGLQNPGVEVVANGILPFISQKFDTNIIVNISGRTPEEYSQVAERLASVNGLEAIEVNISCPNVKQGGMAFGTTVDGASSVVRAVRKAWPRTLIVKLSPNVTDITEIARAVEAEGADAVSLINTMLGMAIDVERRRPMLSTITGGLSGLAIRPVALRMVWQTAKAVKIPVIGLGGINDADSALQFIMAGAKAIQIGTSNFTNPHTCEDVLDGISDFCQRQGVKNISEIIGII